MVFALGFVLFALGITLSIALHECGHMWTAQATGMKVRRYFIGFGPRIFSFRRGETEYGLKALPLGGFCDIAGMTALDELRPEELDRAMYRQATWKRLLVMSGGIAMNFVLGFILIVVLAVGWGLPNLTEPPATALGPMSCVPQGNPDGSTVPCTGTGPAQRAGLQRGDIVKEVNGVKVDTWKQFQAETQKQTGPFTYLIERDGQTLAIPVTPERVMRYPEDGGAGREVGAVGVAPDRYEPVQYNVLAAIPAAGAFTGDMFVRTVDSLAQMPAKVSSLWVAVTGGERDPETPVSVYGASKIGGETAERGYWNMFILVLASLNFFLGVFNLLPLLPLDGGHIAVVIYEKIRNTIRGWKGLAPGAPVNYLKLLPVTYVFVVIGGAYMLLTLAADIVNPIRLF
ncbi:site-2 protease family protein [Nocardia amamiensis]|uniref:Zinc metalloprotease Rip1 n=1 Tax=Nocardia amamiensis TaxID=404578 RepID=A0ABS0CIZ1_9NOCA|nr:M50 family metallopeptidase [Nocardia amamiensis]MBF6296554.1 site-2 protease family protein [Nocardia amamiensis]